MSQRYRVEKAIDQAIGRRILSTCWLFAGLGCSILQMLLLAQAWSLNQQAFVPACMASAWVLGAVLGMRLRADARLLGKRSGALRSALAGRCPVHLLADEHTFAPYWDSTPEFPGNVSIAAGNDQLSLAFTATALVTCW